MGHSAHLYYNTLRGRLTSMGQRLRATDSSSVYRIGLIAGGGNSYDISDADLIPISRRSIPDASEFSSDSVLQTLSATTGHDEYFIDLSRLDARKFPQFFVAGVTRFELRGKQPAILARDFDGAIYVNLISVPRLGFGGPFLVAAAGLKGSWLDHTLLVTLIAVLATGLASRRVVAVVAARRRARRAD
ncbi:MAG: hypothetical protein ABI035_00230 [Gemmatimonadaceae bacterium]